MGAPRFVFNIPFTPKKVEEILHGEHPFGPDSVNITKHNKVIFYGKFDGFRGMPHSGVPITHTSSSLLLNGVTSQNWQ